jgi:hypothetical protein
MLILEIDLLARLFLGGGPSNDRAGITDGALLEQQACEQALTIHETFFASEDDRIASDVASESRMSSEVGSNSPCQTSAPRGMWHRKPFNLSSASIATLVSVRS